MAKFESGKGLPCGWALLPGKSSEIYTFLIDKLVEKVNADGISHRPERICLDFEAAMLKVLQAKFPGINLTCCFFHFRKNIWEKLQALGLTRLYNKDPEFQTWVNLIASLAYVPTDKIIEYYETVVLKILDKKEAEAEEAEENGEEDGEEGNGEEAAGFWSPWFDDIYSYVDYLERTYIGKRSAVTTRNTTNAVPRRKPLYPHSLWNQFKLVTADEEMQSLDGTNNIVESFNRTTNRLMGQKPNIWSAIGSFISQEAETRRVLISNLAGLDHTVNQGRKKKVQQHHAMICSTVRGINDVSPLVYLKTLSNIINGDS